MPPGSWQHRYEVGHESIELGRNIYGPPRER